jgi:hypothetical protein
MDGTLMNLLHGNLNRLSEENLKSLINYYATGILTWQERSSLLGDLTKPKDTSKVLLSLD